MSLHLATRHLDKASRRRAVVPAQSGRQRTFVTDEEGRFHAPFLTPGTHRIRVELTGFRPASVESIQVQSGLENQYVIDGVKGARTPL